MDKGEATCKVVAFIEEYRIIVAQLIGELALRHADSTSHNISIALSEVLQTHKDVLINIPCVKNFKDTRDSVINAVSRQVEASIDPQGLDLTLSINILRYIDGLIPNGAADNKPCISPNHVECKCKKKHPCQQKKRAKDVFGRHPGWASYHRCKECDKNGRKQSEFYIIQGNDILFSFNIDYVQLFYVCIY